MRSFRFFMCFIRRLILLSLCLRGGWTEKRRWDVHTVRGGGGGVFVAKTYIRCDDVIPSDSTYEWCRVSACETSARFTSVNCRLAKYMGSAP